MSTADTQDAPAPATCHKCGSPRVMWFRLDADWGMGAGDFSRLNDDSFYEPGDPEERDEIDLEGRFCLKCREFCG